MRSHLLLLLLLLVVSAAAENRRKGQVGGWKQIKDVGDAHVQDVAAFAVAEYNKAEKADLVFKKVIRGQTQVVSGVRYRLIVEAAEADVVSRYEAVVWEKVWENFRKLTEFKPVSN
ncbi:cysteine proteinase inhibitor 1-like [Aristolochia californica]|uniref:cysteine proteinase inhibitor 1-like n=1 Tax=Aristolochia californica TaxID=171875 RepID=UPI0035E1DD7F